MKRLNQLLAAVAVTFLVPLTISGSASAASTCDIGFTGPNSENMCTSIEKYTCSVTNTNTVKITNETDQVVGSGTVSVAENTSGGNATSGSVANTNGADFTVTITNPAPDTEGFGTCVASVTVPAVETPETVVPTSPAPSAGGGGGGGGGGSVSGVQALPVTSGESALPLAAIVTGATALTATFAAGGLLAYRHFHTS